MSLLAAVKEAIDSCKAEQSRIHESIVLFRELLQSLTPQPESEIEALEGSDAADTDTSAGERDDIDLLEKALEKALRVRTGSGSSTKEPDKNKPTRPQTTVRSAPTSTRNDQRKPGSSASSTRGSRPASSSHPGTSHSKKDRGTIQKHPVSSAEVVYHQTARTLQQMGAAASGSGPHHISSGTAGKSGDDPGRAAAAATAPSNKTGGKTSEQVARWRHLRNKQDRLWGKVLAQQRNPVPGRSRFMERMRATFSEDRPRGSADQTGTPADKLTHRGHDLTQRRAAQELLTAPAPDVTTMEELETRDRWRPEGGCLLPRTITYRTEAELREVETLRMRVALLQQELDLERALSDSLFPQLSSIAPGPGCPSAAVLRDLYSLLGEGGERSPTIVLDCEPE